MNALVSSVDGVDYAGQFYKQCDPALIPVQEGDIASSDPAADSPQGRIIFYPILKSIIALC